QCGCMASAGLSTVGDYRILGVLPVRSLYEASYRVGRAYRGAAGEADPPTSAQEISAGRS
ncbi:MAG: hypothetical protein L0170_01550, partial [Acidobacteria bacterium]|nr:hypothetical protein [Acidobacteriota bacterium]